MAEPMTHEEAFLADIREHPDDDAPRLIFADWLEENGDPERAEFIRVLIACESGYLARAGTLLEKNWGRWVVPLTKLVGPERHERWLTPILSVARTTAAGQFPRGFVSELSLGAQRFLDHAGAIYRLAPLTELALHGAGGRGRELAQCPSLRGIRSLGFLDFYTSPLDGRDVADLADSEYLDRLTILQLQYHNLGDLGVRALAEARWLPQLCELNLTETGFSLDALRVLAERARFDSLRVLHLNNNYLGAEGAAILARAPWLRHLTSLTLRNNLNSQQAKEALREAAPHVDIAFD